MNHRSVTTWIKRLFAGESPIMDWEELSPDDRARELCVLGLRMCEGVDLAAFQHCTGVNVKSLAPEAIAKNIEQGLLEETATHLRLTREGRFVADSVVAEFL